MHITAISDTHTQHHKLNLPAGEMLIHAGDISSRGAEHEVLDFIEWFGEQDFKYKIFIAGNHDFFFEKFTKQEIDKLLPKGVIYLQDSGVEIEGIKIWGSPISPWFFDWAFNRHRGEDIAKHWALIPKDTDVLITHGPVFDVLDETIGGEKVGCKDLLKTLKDLQLKAHICGHIHEAYGMQEIGSTKFINASVLNQRYWMVNEPVVFEL
jgi:Icc-related predicted phosphoesterase